MSTTHDWVSIILGSNSFLFSRSIRKDGVPVSTGRVVDRNLFGHNDLSIAEVMDALFSHDSIETIYLHEAARSVWHCTLINEVAKLGPDTRETSAIAAAQALAKRIGVFK